MFGTSSRVIALLAGVAFVTLPGALGRGEPLLVTPLKELFHHKAHQESFAKNGVSCTDCHTFSVKTQTSDPLAAKVPAGLLRPDRMVCHQCHLQAVKTAAQNQCALCHGQKGGVMPESHHLNWKLRHGRMAQQNPESCAECHKEAGCGDCHTQRDTLKPSVHRPNFRYTHSIEARAKPQSCTACHSTSTMCINCHSQGYQ